MDYISLLVSLNICLISIICVHYIYNSLNLKKKKSGKTNNENLVSSLSPLMIKQRKQRELYAESRKKLEELNCILAEIRISDEQEYLYVLKELERLGFKIEPVSKQKGTTKNEG